VVEVTSNVGGSYDAESGLLVIENQPACSALLITTHLKNPLSSQFLISGEFCAITLFHSPHAEQQKINNEFVFIVDCSGSMNGKRIEQARDCLCHFIRSLPPESFFNIIRFGSTFEKFFPSCMKYNKQNAEMALDLAKMLEADLGGTNLSIVLDNLYATQLKGNGGCQVFILTDGEITNTDYVLRGASLHCEKYRFFVTGFGSADAGLIEGLASATAGQSAFLSDGDDLNEIVASQLSHSMSLPLTKPTIHIPGCDEFEVVPFPIPTLSEGISATVLVRAKEKCIENIIANGERCGEVIDFVCEGRESSSFRESISALFAYESIRVMTRSIEMNQDIEGKLKSRCVALSMESGVLCNYTAFVGVSEQLRSETVSIDQHRFRNVVSAVRRVHDLGKTIGDPLIVHSRRGKQLQPLYSRSPAINSLIGLVSLGAILVILLLVHIGKRIFSK
jgi:uncharacterized protein YegL